MKEQYIRQVEKELKVPRNRKREILRDLQEAFASALEHGETEAQVIQRLGTPKEFANSTAEQLGVDPVRGKKRKQLLAGLLCLVVAAAAFAGYAAGQLSQTPADAIGQADAMTNIQVTGGLAFLRPASCWRPGSSLPAGPWFSSCGRLVKTGDNDETLYDPMGPVAGPFPKWLRPDSRANRCRAGC